MMYRQDLDNEINECLRLMKGHSYEPEKFIFPTINGEIESKRISELNTHLVSTELLCRKAECFQGFCLVFTNVIREIVQRLDNATPRLSRDDEFNVDSFIEEYLKPLQEKQNGFYCNTVIGAVNKFLTSKKDIENLIEKRRWFLFFRNSRLYFDYSEDDEIEEITKKRSTIKEELYDDFAREYAFEYVETCEEFKDVWTKGNDGKCSKLMCNFAFLTHYGDIYVNQSNGNSNLCVQDGRLDYHFNDLRTIKKHLNLKFGLKYLLKHGMDRTVQHYISSRIRPFVKCSPILPQMPYFAQVAKEILGFYLRTEIEKDLIADNHDEIQKKIRMLYSDLGLVLANRVPYEILIDRIFSLNKTLCANAPTFVGDYPWKYYLVQSFLPLNKFVNLFKGLYTLTGGNIATFNQFAAFLTSVYAGRKISTSLLNKGNATSASIYIFVTPNRTFVEEFLREIFNPSPISQYHNKGKIFEFKEYKYYLDAEDHVHVHHYTEYTIDQLCDSSNVGKFIEDQFYGHMLNVTSLKSKVSEDKLKSFAKLAFGEVVEGQNRYLGTQFFSSNSTYVFIVDESYDYSLLKKCFPNVHVIELDKNMSTQIHLRRKELFNPFIWNTDSLPRSEFNELEKLYIVTKIVEYGYFIHRCGNGFILNNIEDIIKQFVEICGKRISIPDGDEKQVVSSENSTTLSAFNEAFSKFYKILKSKDWSTKFDIRNFDSYFKKSGLTLSDEFKCSGLYGLDETKNEEIKKGYNGVKDKSRYVKGFVVDSLRNVEVAANTFAKQSNDESRENLLDEAEFVERLVNILDEEPQLYVNIDAYQDFIKDDSIHLPQLDFEDVTELFTQPIDKEKQKKIDLRWYNQTHKEPKNDETYVQRVGIENVDDLINTVGNDKKKESLSVRELYGL